MPDQLYPAMPPATAPMPAPIRALLLESPIKAPSPAPKAAPAPAPTAVFPPWDIWDGCVMFAHPPNMPATARQATAWLVRIGNFILCSFFLLGQRQHQLAAQYYQSRSSKIVTLWFQGAGLDYSDRKSTSLNFSH